jgi:branched-chain amino acid transport system substrate-binding protein
VPDLGGGRVAVVVREGRRLPVALVAIALIAAGCAGQTAEPDRPVVRIALEGPITGEQASNGLDMLRGARLAVEEANGRGGILGRDIVLVPADDRADPDLGVEVAREVVNRRVFAVIGPYNSSVGVENLSIYLDHGVIPIHLTSDSATNGQGFTVQPKDYQVAPIEAEAITEFFEAKRVAMLYDPSTYTVGIARQLRGLLLEAGVEILAFERADPDGSEVDLLRRIMADKPDLLYASTYYPQGARIARETLKLGLSGTCLMGLANQDPGFVQQAGLEAARACASSGVPEAGQFPGATAYVDAYSARFDTEPGTWGSFTYDSAKLLFDAVRRAGTWDPDAVRGELAATEGYDGITGTISIDPSTGNRVDVPVVILEIDGEGNYVVNQGWSRFAGFGA